MKSSKNTFFKVISTMVIVFAMVSTTNLNAQGPPGGPTDTEDTLSTNENDLDVLNIFVLNRSKELIVSGQLKENTRLDVYDLYGRKVLSTELDLSIVQNRINLSSLSRGVYVVNLQNETGQKSQKVVIK
jgi:hypothetical protein